MSDRIVVVDYGMGNIHSILKALRLYAGDVMYTNDVSAIRNARALVLPGDGAFAAAMQGLAGPLEDAIRDFVEHGRPLLGVCIGFQVLFEDSDETHDDSGDLVRGLGLIRGNIRRFHFKDEHVRVPHMGWNRLLPSESRSTDGDYVYFIHSYRAENVPARNVVANCNYAGDVFPAIVRNDAGNVIAAQFHPEKSDTTGLAMLQAWVQEPERQLV